MRIIFCLMILFIFGCKMSNQLSRENLSANYELSFGDINPTETIYHRAKDSTLCLFQIPISNLLINYSGKDMSNIVKVKVHYEIYPSYNEKSFIDSGSVIQEQGVDMFAKPETKWFYGSFNFPFGMGCEGVLKLKYTDLNRKTTATHLVNIKKNTIHDPQFYMLVDSNFQPLHHNCISPGEDVVFYSELDDAPFYWVKCYFNHYPFALPPFTTSPDYIFNLKADSIFKFKREDYEGGNEFHLKLKKYGFYFIQKDSSLRSGATLFVYNNKYPFVSTAAELIEATRYLTTQQEYTHLIESTNKKKAADEFWLSLAGDPDRAREAIKVYYNRTQFANFLFTSYTEGWKTDRGMIYIIFGSPRSVYRDGATETWSYFTNPGTPELLFTFKKMGNPFTDNDYSLIREPAYESIWFLAVEQWRQGRVVNNND